MEESSYHGFYARHRFAATKKKGGWELLPYNKNLEAAYNATVHALLEHTRRCLSAESMAAHVLRTLGLWPTRRPLKLLFVTCGWGFTAMGDGWQGPVSIGLFLGLHYLLRNNQGSRIIDAPAMDVDEEVWPGVKAPTSSFWYLFKRAPGCQFNEQDLRERMYGFGFSYARMLRETAMATQEERNGVQKALANREFDAIIYGKVGPRQGCDPLPFLEDALAAGYPPQRIAFIYGGDFGLASSEISRHARLMGSSGSTFFRKDQKKKSKDEKKAEN